MTRYVGRRLSDGLYWDGANYGPLDGARLYQGDLASSLITIFEELVAVNVHLTPVQEAPVASETSDRLIDI